MQNKEVVKLENAQVQVRDIGTITFEIVNLKAQAVNSAMLYYIEIGKRLTEAKQLVPHGEWGKWLKEQVDFEKSTANNLMNIYEEYGKNPNLQTFGNLTYSKAVKLLSVPSEEREDFVQKNDVENMTSRELDKAIKERDEALKKVEELGNLKQQLNDARGKVKELETKANSLASQSLSLQKKLEKANATVKNLKENPVVSDEVINGIKDKLKTESKKDLEDAIAKNQNALDLALKEKEKAQATIEDLNAKMLALEKKVKLSNTDVVEFNMLYVRVQKDFKALRAIIDRVSINDKETADKLNKAIIAFCNEVIK